MNFHLTTKKEIAGISLIALLGSVSYYAYNYYQEKQDYRHQEAFVIEYNKSLEELQNVEVVKNKEEQTIEQEEAINSENDINKQKAEDEKEVVLEKKQSIEAKRTVESYSESLPLAPNPIENNLTLLGVDSNNNGVRDDIEIDIVSRFKNDRYVVEAFLAQRMVYQKELELFENGDLNKEKLRELVQLGGKVSSCLGYVYGKSKYQSDNSLYAQLDESFYDASEGIHKKFINTQSRKEAVNDIEVAQHLMVSEGIVVSDELCTQIILNTKLIAETDQ